MKNNISESENFMVNYLDLLQKVKTRWHVDHCQYIGISKSKGSRVINGQFDILTIIKMASFVGYDSWFHFRERSGYE